MKNPKTQDVTCVSCGGVFRDDSKVESKKQEAEAEKSEADSASSKSVNAKASSLTASVEIGEGKAVLGRALKRLLSEAEGEESKAEREGGESRRAIRTDLYREIASAAEAFKALPDSF